MIIPGYSHYDITEDGIVTNIETGKALKAGVTWSNGYAYKMVSIVGDDGVKRKVSLLRLLATAYLPKPDCACVARSKDGDNTNTILQNVEWVPCTERVKLDWSNGLMDNRKKRNRCYDKHSIALVYDTLEAIEEPMSVAALSRMLDIPYSTVRYSVDALEKRGRVRRTKYGVEVQK